MFFLITSYLKSHQWVIIKLMEKLKLPVSKFRVKSEPTNAPLNRELILVSTETIH